MKKYHFSLSLAGEDRKFVDKVAKLLREKGVDVFFDKFVDTTLWGKMCPSRKFLRILGLNVVEE